MRLLLSTLVFCTSTTLAFPPRVCTVSYAPAYSGLYNIFLKPDFSDNMTQESQQVAAKEVADDLHLDLGARGTQIVLFDSLTMIAARITWERACEISRDSRVRFQPAEMSSLIHGETLGQERCTQWTG